MPAVRFLAVILLVASFAVGGEPPRQHTPPAVPDLIRDLGSPRFADRERASRELWKLGPAAVAAVRAAAEGDDPEAARRARDLLEKFDAGIFADTPPLVLAKITEFRAGRYIPAVTGLVKLGDKGLPALRAQLSRHLPAEANGPVFDHLCWLLRGEVPRMLFDGRADLAEELLALHALGPSTQGLSDYAILLALRGRTAQAATELEPTYKAGGPTALAAGRALVFVYRAAGELKKATALAGELEAGPAGRAMYDALLEDGGAWGELADRSARQIGPANSRDGLTLFRLRLAGRHKEADELADRQIDADTGRPGQDLFRSVDEPTLALLLGGRPLDGIDRLRAKQSSPHLLADVLAARMEYQEALGLVTPAPADRRLPRADPFDAPDLRQLYGTRKGRLLSQLGDRDEAGRVFNELADQLFTTNRDEYTLTQLLRSEVRAGRYDLACDHLARGLATGDTSGRLEPCEAVFEGDAEAAEYLWRALRADDKATPPGETMRKVRALLTGAAAAADQKKAVEAAGKDFAWPGSTRGQVHALALAGVYRSSGQSADAITALSEAADTLAKLDDDEADTQQARRSGRGSRSWVFGTDERFRLWMELGDLLADAGRWKDAAARYEQGWRRFPDCAVLMFLSGRALQKAGDDAEGKRRIELAHWVGLGNARVRGRFLEELIGRGYTVDIRRERDLIRDAGWLSEMYLGNVWNQVARAASGLKDFSAAAAANRRAMHYLLRTPGVSYVEGHAYLSVPQAVRGFEARALLAAGKSDEALSVARGCLDVLPGNVELASAMVPMLDKAGRTDDAETLFRTVWAAFEKLIAAHPKSAWARYSAAWLAAGCRRNLDAALTHAKEAVALEPDVRSYREALAEVHFRRGERAEAVAGMARLSAADPRHHHFRRQLERYRTAPTDSPLPESPDD